MSDEHLKPFILASSTDGADAAAAVDATINALKGACFEIVGTYSPNEDSKVICFTNEEQKSLASKSNLGGFGAVLRCSVTKVKSQVQIAYTNPTYMAVAYRMATNNAAMSKKLSEVLGNKGEFGSKKGIRAEKLAKYHYAVGMEYFDEVETLAKYKTHAEAVKACEDCLAANKAGGVKVFQVAVPGKEEVVFGVGLKSDNKFANDAFIASIIDFGETKSAAHFPYEMMAVGPKIVMMHARFRIAVNYIDLEMTGHNSFMTIMDTPKAIKKTLQICCGGKEEK